MSDNRIARPGVRDLALPDELIERFRAQDEYAIKYVFDIYFNRLFTYIYHEVGNNTGVAEDIVQDTFIGAVKNARRFQGSSQIYTWLVSIAHHNIADHFRRLKKEKSQSLENIGANIALNLVEEESSAASMIEKTEDRLIIQEALSSLPEDYRRTLVLKYVEEMPVAEICRIMQRSPKSVEGLLTRARRAPRDKLNDRNKG